MLKHKKNRNQYICHANKSQWPFHQHRERLKMQKKSVCTSVNQKLLSVSLALMKCAISFLFLLCLQSDQIIGCGYFPGSQKTRWQIDKWLTDSVHMSISFIDSTWLHGLWIFRVKCVIARNKKYNDNEKINTWNFRWKKYCIASRL